MSLYHPAMLRLIEQHGVEQVDDATIRTLGYPAVMVTYASEAVQVSKYLN